MVGIPDVLLIVGKKARAGQLLELAASMNDDVTNEQQKHGMLSKQKGNEFGYQDDRRQRNIYNCLRKRKQHAPSPMSRSRFDENIPQLHERSMSQQVSSPIVGNQTESLKDLAEHSLYLLGLCIVEPPLLGQGYLLECSPPLARVVICRRCRLRNSRF